MTAVLASLGLAAIALALWGDRVAALPRRPSTTTLDRRPALLGRRTATMRDRRAALPGLVEAIAAALASGLSMHAGFAEVASTLPAPLDHAAYRVASSLRLGDPIAVALRSFDGVVPAADLAPFAVVIGAFARAGGRVGRSLDRVALLLRGRLALEDERAALTAQGRVSAIVLVALAPLGAMFFALLLPDHTARLFERAAPLAILAVALEVLGALWLWRIVRANAPAADLSTLIDAVVVGLDAGLTFEQSLAALVARAPDVARLPEARRLLADLTLGRGAGAFTEFARAGPAEARVAGLVRAATRLGSPLADLLVTQADALRLAERRRAEARARRLPVLMLFPLAFCILPALLIVFLGPPLLSLVK